MYEIHNHNRTGAQVAIVPEGRTLAIVVHPVAGEPGHVRIVLSADDLRRWSALLEIGAELPELPELPELLTIPDNPFPEVPT